MVMKEYSNQRSRASLTDTVQYLALENPLMWRWLTPLLGKKSKFLKNFENAVIVRVVSLWVKSYFDSWTLSMVSKKKKKKKERRWTTQCHRQFFFFPCRCILVWVTLFGQMDSTTDNNIINTYIQPNFSSTTPLSLSLSLSPTNPSTWYAHRRGW